MRAYFVSDLHLVDADDERTRLFIRFLEALRDAPEDQQTTHLFLVGDIFDFWIADHAYFQDRFRAVVNLILELIHQGVEVHYFEGNHDLHLTDFWQHNVGAFVHRDHADFELASLKVRVEHGDLINPDDKGYLFLRRLLRTSLVEALSFHLPHFVVGWIGERASQASRQYTSHAKSLPQAEIRNLIRAHAHRLANEAVAQNGNAPAFDLIVSGHVHVRDDESFEVAGRKVRSVNLGSWFDEAKALMISDVGTVSWIDIATFVQSSKSD